MEYNEKPIYLDYNATTPIEPGVRDAMLPYLEEYFGNPSSGYAYGQRAKQAVEKARGQVAALIGATPEEIIFTSGGSESVAMINWFLFCPGNPRPAFRREIQHTFYLLCLPRLEPFQIT